jgi:hypothetical protein
MNTSLHQPWYKHRWPWILISGPFIAMVACVITIYLAFQKQDVLIVNGVKKTGLKVVEESSSIKPAMPNLSKSGEEKK